MNKPNVNVINNENDKLGIIVKSARLKNNLTRKQFAKRLNISPRYLIAIENENQKPSYELLFQLIRELSIPANIIFYPELEHDYPDMERLRLLLARCDEKEINVFTTTLQSLIDSKL